jgi:very-short-patch-repair endonuclease
MAHDLVSLLGPWGVARTTDLARRVDRHSLAAWVAAGRLVRPHRGVVALPESLDQWSTRALAAVLATNGPLSHTSALTVWRLLPESEPIHLSVPAHRRASRRGGVVVHRVDRLLVDRVGPFAVTDLPRSLVDSWSMACGRGTSRSMLEQVRGAVITSLRDRRVRATVLRAEVSLFPTLRGRAGLLSLIGLVENGCQSELEIWGVREVLRGPGMPPFRQQYPVRLPFGTVHLDAAVPEVKVAVEMDGAAYHGSAQARERDNRRDVALAALGWVVLRFGYRRLTGDPDGCRQEIIQVCRGRAALFAG